MPGTGNHICGRSSSSSGSNSGNLSPWSGSSRSIRPRITSWKWDFGDGETSTDQNPIHQYKKAGEYVVVLSVDGPDGKGRFSRVWDVTVK